MKKTFFNMVTILSLTFVFLFLFQNFADVSLKFLAWEIELPRAVLMAITFAAGYFVGISVKIKQSE